jgi:hypothetical protein
MLWLGPTVPHFFKGVSMQAKDDTPIPMKVLIVMTLIAIIAVAFNQERVVLGGITLLCTTFAVMSFQAVLKEQADKEQNFLFSKLKAWGARSKLSAVQVYARAFIASSVMALFSVLIYLLLPLVK